MGDRRKQALRVQFDGKIKLRFHGAKIASDAGLLAFCELDEAFRWTERGGTVLSDPRHRKNAQYTMPAMVRQSVLGRLAGNENVSPGAAGTERLRGGILRQFAPVANEADPIPKEQIDILVTTDTLSEGRNLPDCGVIIHYDLTGNPIRLVQRDGRIHSSKPLSAFLGLRDPGARPQAAVPTRSARPELKEVLERSIQVLFICNTVISSSTLVVLV